MLIREGYAIGVAVLLAGSVAAGQTARRPVPTEYTGVTTNLTPGSGATLSIQVVNWSADSDRQRVLAVLGKVSADGTALQDLTKQLADVPTAGHIWTTDAALGYSLKYAHRASLPDGGERIVVVTDRPLGVWDRPGPWQAGGQAKVDPFTVVELHLNKNGKGEGKMSLTTPFTVNDSDQTLSLSKYESASVTLKNVERKPKPYWARETESGTSAGKTEAAPPPTR